MSFRNTSETPTALDLLRFLLPTRAIAAGAPGIPAVCVSCVCVCVSVCLSVCLSLCRSVCLSLSLSLCTIYIYIYTYRYLER